jgi:hypothetical protein
VAGGVEVGQVRGLRLERQVRPVDHLAGSVEARDRETPVSITATSDSLAGEPAFHHAWAPEYSVVEYIEFTSGRRVVAVASPAGAGTGEREHGEPA